MVIPSLDKVKELAKDYNVIPVCRSVLADTETPVSVWMKLFGNEKCSFLLESVSGEETVSRYSFLGGSPYMTFVSNINEWKINGIIKEKGVGAPVEKLRSLMASYKAAKIPGLPRFTGGAVGYFSYDSIRLWENIPDNNPKDDSLDDIHFSFYKNLVAFDNREHRLMLISNIILDNGDDVEKKWHDAVHELGKMQDKMAVRISSGSISVKVKSETNSNFIRGDFEAAVEKCKEYIKAGDIFQVVLSQRFSIKVQSEPINLYRILRVINPSPYMYFLSQGNTFIIGASPEMLVRVENGIVETRPIAGTRKRGKSDEEDEKLIEELKADPKECAEHVMLVDLGRNDLGRVCDYGSVKVEKMMHAEKYSHVIHLVSNVIGKLDAKKDCFDALYSCFPAGTLSGAPKIRAMEIIDELEPVKRGLYGGALGYLDFNGNMDTCIVIRTIIYNNETACIQAGAGIVADSVPANEYMETVQKATASFEAIKNSNEIIGKN